MLVNIFKKPEILNKEVHKDLKISSYEDYAFAKDAFVVPLGLNEMLVAQKSLIIVFLKDTNGDIFPSAVLGGEEGGNILLTKDNKWKENTYIPAVIRTYPFGIGHNADEKFITLDSAADVFKKDNGERILNDDQSLTKQGEHVVKFVQDVYQQIEETKKFTSAIDAFGLLKQANLVIEIGEEKYNLTKGVYILDENSLNKLESRKLKKLATSGMMKYIYSHILSLSNKY